jgi:hypothetical protein
MSAFGDRDLAVTKMSSFVVDFEGVVLLCCFEVYLLIGPMSDGK